MKQIAILTTSIVCIFLLLHCDKSVNDDPELTYSDDSLAVRALLDANGLQAVPVDSVAIIDTVENRIGELVLSNRNITIIPSQIQNLTYLKKLNLEFNDLTAVPDEMGELEKLSLLYLAVNNFSEINPAVFQLPLQHLTLGSNQLSFLPAEIGNCPTLMQLQLSDNKLNCLPPGIGNLRMLQTLWCESNLLTTLPDTIATLTTVKAHFDKNYLSDSTLSPEVIAWLDGIDPTWRDSQISSR